MKDKHSGADYSNSAAIIQSSGSGKSRMVDKLAELVFTVPFNVRQTAESNGALPHGIAVGRSHSTPLLSTDR